MAEDPNTTHAFNEYSMASFVREFTTPTAQMAAIDAFTQNARATSTAERLFQRVLDQNRPDQSKDYTPDGTSQHGSAKIQRVQEAHVKYRGRLDKLETAMSNRMDAIRQHQKIEIRVRQKMGGETLSKTFRRHR